MQRGRWIRRVGAGLMLLGALALLFVAYQLWGTGLYTSQAQGHLRSELARQLHHSLPTTSQVASASSRKSSGLPPLAVVPAQPMPAPPVGSPIGLLAIPKIGLEDAIVEGVSEAQLEQGPGHYPGTPLPGEWGNVGIAGHRTTYAHPFYNLNELATGDPIYVLTVQGLFKYVVAEQFTVDPSDVSVVQDSTGQPTLTLTTCNPRYSAAQRLVVVADFSPGTGAASTSTSAESTRPPTADGRRSGRSASRLTNPRAGAGDALGGTANSPVPAVLWGAGTLLAAIAVLVVRRRTPRRFRWMPSAAGLLGVLVVLFFFFEHLSLALPASF